MQIEVSQSPNGLNANKSPCKGILAYELEALLHILDDVLDSHVRDVIGGRFIEDLRIRFLFQKDCPISPRMAL
jgi:hypothetical protein